jgi:hypothetical protein
MSKINAVKETTILQDHPLNTSYGPSNKRTIENAREEEEKKREKIKILIPIVIDSAIVEAIVWLYLDFHLSCQYAALSVLSELCLLSSV